jgi:hypothetical protein
MTSPALADADSDGLTMSFPIEKPSLPQDSDAEEGLTMSFPMEHPELESQNFAQRARRAGLSVSDEEKFYSGEDLLETLDLSVDPGLRAYSCAGPTFVTGRQRLSSPDSFDPAAYEIRPPYVFFSSFLVFLFQLF